LQRLAYRIAVAKKSLDVEKGERGRKKEGRR
jgi:hypothetical protein